MYGGASPSATSKLFWSDPENVKVLQKNLASLYGFNLCIFFGDEFCGWFYGEQQNNRDGMKKILIKPDQFKIMPWKNGAGVTAQIDIDPPESDFKNGQFNWRLSSARVEDENQFSQFPGYDRLLTVLSGDGLILNSQELGPFEVIEFQGEDIIHCSLIDHAVEDLGLIFKRDQYRASMTILEVTAPMYLNLGAGTHFFLSLSLDVTLASVELRPPEVLKIQEAQGIEITTSRYPAAVLKISIVDTKA